MPDVIHIRVSGQPPAHNNSLKTFLVDELMEHGLPFQHLNMHYNAGFLKVFFDDLRCFQPCIIALIHQNREFKGFPILFENAVPSFFPAGLLQQGPCLFRIIFEIPDIGVICP